MSVNFHIHGAPTSNLMRWFHTGLREALLTRGEVEVAPEQRRHQVGHQFS